VRWPLIKIEHRGTELPGSSVCESERAPFAGYEHRSESGLECRPAALDTGHRRRRRPAPVSHGPFRLQRPHPREHDRACAEDAWRRATTEVAATVATLGELMQEMERVETMRRRARRVP